MIYMVGDATPAGWTIGDATPMQTTDNPYVFTWKGTLNAGELKLLVISRKIGMEPGSCRL